MNKQKYLVRPDDFHVFELDASNNCYRSYELREIENRPDAYDHFTFENLTKNYGFFAINESEIEVYEKKNKLYHKWFSWSLRSDGHGGTKGGTMEEYIKLFGTN